MKEKEMKMSKKRIYTYRTNAVKRGRLHRFSKWVEQTYGVSWITMYDKLKKNRVKTWEGAGISKCLAEYGFHGNPRDLWNKCKRNLFCDFMESKQMSRMTVWRRFAANDFSKLEMDGIQATYKQWREEIDNQQSDNSAQQE